MFAFMLTRMSKAPKVCIYDFGCSLSEYCLNREPEYFKYMLIFLDKLHEWNHSACSDVFKIRLYFGDLEVTVDEWIDRINTQVSEQWNSMFAVKAVSIQQCGQASVMRDALHANRRRNEVKNRDNAELRKGGSNLPSSS